MLDRLRSSFAVAISSLHGGSGAFQDRPPTCFAVERGVAWPLLDDEPAAPAFAWVEPMLGHHVDLQEIDVIDAAGHRRSVYPGLLAYALFQAIRASDRVLLGEPAEVAIRHIQALQDDVRAGRAELRDESIPASGGDSVAALAWKALALFAGGELLHEDRVLRTAGRAIGAVVARQQPSGAYLLPSKHDNPETLWLHELQILHALASFGLQAGEAAICASAARAAAFHLNETQPDHATHQPWGLPAFLIDPQTHIMADGMVHAASIEQPEQLSGVSLILLADALYSLRRR